MLYMKGSLVKAAFATMYYDLENKNRFLTNISADKKIKQHKHMEDTFKEMIHMLV
jgi:hypothetical protein